ncbi:MAG: hypothetical protein CSA74_02090 [Rhodobacterales bacterium]|nr:MAG: hypothetical protein CSA74_02090 [Rhodobacterales bacterium]
MDIVLVPSVSAAPAFALHTARPEEAFIDLDHAEHGPRFFAYDQDTFAQAAIDPVDRIAVCAGEFSRLEGAQIG